jgi:hypothetical protein
MALRVGGDEAALGIRAAGDATGCARPRAHPYKAEQPLAVVAGTSA